MAIARKPVATPPVDVAALIAKGGSVAQKAAAQEDRKLAQVVLRLPAAMLAKVDAAVQARPVPTARTTWIMEAITEKLGREG